MQTKIMMNKTSLTWIRAIQWSTLAAITFYGATQITQPSFALFTDNARNEMKVQAAFIFPETIHGLINQVEKYKESAKKHYEKILELLEKLTEQRNLQKIMEIQGQIISENKELDKDRQQIQTILSQLIDAQKKASDEVHSAEMQLAKYPSNSILKNNLLSAKYVLRYVKDGLENIQDLASKADGDSKSANTLLLKMKTMPLSLEPSQSQPENNSQLKQEITKDGGQNGN